MESSEMEGNTTQKMAPAKPPLRPMSSYQVLQKTTFGDAVGTSISPPLAPNENNKVENSLTRNAVSGSAFVDSTSKLAEQIQAPKSDMDCNLEQKILDDKRLKRIMSNRLSAQRSRLKKLGFLANLEIQAKTLEDKIAELQPQLASYKNQKQFLMMEQQILHQQMETLRKEILFRDAEIEKNKGEVSRLRELLAMQQAEQSQAQLLNMNFGLMEPVCNDPISNYTNSYQVAGNGVETSSILEPSQMWIPTMPNIHELDLSFPNYMGSMDQMDLIRGTAPNPQP